VRGEGLLNVVHFDALRRIPGPPEQAVDEHLQEETETILVYTVCRAKTISNF
jgi:hypothetical protein